MLRKSGWVGVLLTVAILAILFSKIDVGQVWGRLQQANYLLVLPAAVCTLLGYGVRTARWRTILAGAVPANFAPLFSILMIGFATNNVLPARLGEFVRAVLVRRRTGLRKTFSLATIFLERLFDGLTLVAILAVLSAHLPLQERESQVRALSGLLFVSVALGVGLLLMRERLVARLLELLLRPLPGTARDWALEAFSSFVLGLRGVRRPRIIFLTLGLSLVTWSLEGLSYYLLTYAFDFPLQGWERVVACGVMLVIVNLGIMIPSAPGYIGPFQAAAVAALALFSVSPDLALSLALVSHAMQWVLVTAVGALFVMREHLSWSGLVRAGADESEGVEAVEAGSAR